MNDDLIIQRVRAAIQEESKLSAEERFADMVRRGVIDEQGRVLLGRTAPPRAPRKSRKKPPEA